VSNRLIAKVKMNIKAYNTIWHIYYNHKLYRNGFEYDLRRKGSKISFEVDWRQKYENSMQKYVNPPFFCFASKTWHLVRFSVLSMCWFGTYLCADLMHIYVQI